jgi:hypothetical protein
MKRKKERKNVLLTFINNISNFKDKGRVPDRVKGQNDMNIAKERKTERI